MQLQLCSYSHLGDNYKYALLGFDGLLINCNLSWFFWREKGKLLLPEWNHPSYSPHPDFLISHKIRPAFPCFMANSLTCRYFISSSIKVGSNWTHSSVFLESLLKTFLKIRTNFSRKDVLQFSCIKSAWSEEIQVIFLRQSGASINSTTAKAVDARIFISFGKADHFTFHSANLSND